MPWLALNALAIPGDLHPLPRHLKKVLSKFDLNKKESIEDHVKQFMLDIRLLNVEHEDVVCSLFPFTLDGKASTWYFSLTPGSIHSWDYFQTTFLGKFEDNKTSAKLVLEFSKIKMDPKEKFKYFNQ